MGEKRTVDTYVLLEIELRERIHALREKLSQQAEPDPYLKRKLHDYMWSQKPGLKEEVDAELALRAAEQTEAAH